MDGILKNNYCSLMKNDVIVYYHTMFHLESSAYRSNKFNTLIKLLKCMQFFLICFHKHVDVYDFKSSQYFNASVSIL